jgi:hypothetical protein
MHGIVEFFIYTVGNGFEVAFANACGAQWAFAAVFAAAAVDVHAVAIVVFHFALVGQYGLVATLAFVAVFVLVVDKSFAVGFVLSKIGNVCFEAFGLAVAQGCAAAVACIG